jgi:hypothetical protein
MMRKTTLGISLVALVGFAGTAAADHDHDGDCGHSDYADYGDGYAYSDYDDDYSNYGDDYDYTANGWVTPTIALPQVQTVVVQPRSGYVWVEGRWDWTGYEWTWVEGYWVRARANHDWVQGRWHSHNGHQRWVSGRWNPRKVVVNVNNNHRRHGKRWGNHGGYHRGTTKVIVRNHDRHDRRDRRDRGDRRGGRRGGRR